MSPTEQRNMHINEIFYSLQGEGHFTGHAAVFVRFSGCNMQCPFCDTNHSFHREMSAAEIIEAITPYPSRHVVLTGGEPALQISEHFLALLRDAGFFIQIETNGTVEIERGALRMIDWITCSPKQPGIKLGRVDELKVIFHGEAPDSYENSGIMPKEYRLQPCDTGDCAKNADLLSRAVDYIKKHPQWKLSLQTHKLINIP